MMESPKSVSGFLGMTGHTIDGEKLQPHLYHKVGRLEERINNHEKCLPNHEHLINHCQQGIEKVFERIEKLEAYIEKLHGLINMEDRITASDVLLRLTKLEELNEKCFKANPIAQIEERFKMIEAEFPKIKDAFRFVKFKKPHKCPLCEGEGYKRWSSENMAGGGRCSTCEGIGIVWG